MKAVAALRQQFGGHAVKPAGTTGPAASDSTPVRNAAVPPSA
jgi:6-phosphogluconate dehydrogenase